MAEIKEVFISYHERSAGKLAAEIADRLESAGISCWHAKRDLPPGGDFANYIPPQIDGCKVFLLILNEGANRSRHIESEVGLAFRRYNKGEEIEILPYQTEKCDFARWMDYYLVNIQIMSVENADISALVAEIAHKLGRKPAKNGRCGFKVKWTLKDGILTISKKKGRKKAKMGNFYPQQTPKCVNTPWWSERQKISALIMKDGVANIGRYAFSHFSKLTVVVIPDSVSVIQRGAFEHCVCLRDILIPDSVTNIEKWAFRGCDCLKSVSVPANAEIDDEAFDPYTEVMRRDPLDSAYNHQAVESYETGRV